MSISFETLAVAKKKIKEVGGSSGVGSSIELDTSLSIQGKAADAKSTGDAIDKINNYVAQLVNDLANYYLKSEVYTQDEVNELISVIPKFSIQPVNILPTKDISTTTVYLLKNGEETPNLYTEYIYVDGAWECLGTQTVDLSGYALKTDVPTKLSEFTNDAGYITNAVDNLLNYYNKTIIDEKIAELSEEIADQFNAEQDTATLGEELANANNWTLGTGWSGSFADGFTHTSGNVESLTFAPTIKANTLYQVTFKSSIAMTTSNLFVQVGNSTQFNLYGDKLDDDTISIGLLAVDTTGLVFTPESSFTGTLTDISIKEITGSYEAVQQYLDTNEAVSFEIHVTPRGLENVFIGQSVGEMNTTGRRNVGIGANALASNTSGFWNVAIGSECLKNNIGGSRNLAIGHNALRDNEVGQRNVALGTFAMTQMKDGDWNIAIGSDSMNVATGGNKNTAVGFNTLTHNGGDNNVAVGADVLSANTSGAMNMGMGQGALNKNTTGHSNVCIGHLSGTVNTTGHSNVGIGWASLYKNTTGQKNIAIGYNAGRTITTEKRNIVIGADTDVDATTNDQLNIGNLLKGSVATDNPYLSIEGGLRLPNIATSATGNDGEVYEEEWTFTLEDGSTVTKKVLVM